MNLPSQAKAVRLILVIDVQQDERPLFIAQSSVHMPLLRNHDEFSPTAALTARLRNTGNIWSLVWCQLILWNSLGPRHRSLKSADTGDLGRWRGVEQ